MWYNSNHLQVRIREKKLRLQSAVQRMKTESLDQPTGPHFVEISFYYIYDCPTYYKATLSLEPLYICISIHISHINGSAAALDRITCCVSQCCSGRGPRGKPASGNHESSSPFGPFAYLFTRYSIETTPGEISRGKEGWIWKGGGNPGYLGSTLVKWVSIAHLGFVRIAFSKVCVNFLI